MTDHETDERDAALTKIREIVALRGGGSRMSVEQKEARDTALRHAVTVSIAMDDDDVVKRAKLYLTFLTNGSGE